MGRASGIGAAAVIGRVTCPRSYAPMDHASGGSMGYYIGTAGPQLYPRSCAAGINTGVDTGPMGLPISLEPCAHGTIMGADTELMGLHYMTAPTSAKKYYLCDYEVTVEAWDRLHREA